MGVSGYLFLFVKARFEQELVHEMQLVGELFRANTVNRLRVVEEIVENTAIALGRLEMEKQRTDLLERIVTENQGDIYGMALANTQRDDAPYFYRDSSVAGVNQMNLADSLYRYREKTWFQVVLKDGQAQWSPAYQDTNGGDALMSTYAVPITDQSGRVSAVLTGDLALAWFTKGLEDVTVPEDHQYLFLTARETGALLSGPPSLMKDSVLFSRIVGGAEHQTLCIPIARTDWDVNVAFPRQLIEQKLHRVTFFIFLLSLLGIVLILICIYFIGTTMAKPLRLFTTYVRGFGKGNINQRFPYGSRKDEIGELSRAFTTMQSELNEYIAAIRRSETERQQIVSELAIGRQIQQSLLPNLHDWEKDPNLAITGFLSSAKEVGGDLYDCFLTGDNTLCFFIGDVSGKGIPAALYMNGIRAYIRALAHHRRSPAAIIEQINAELSRHNELCMFATMICGVLCTETGKLSIANAGHEPPIIIEGDGNLRVLSADISPAVAILDTAHYHTRTSVLNRGEMLFLYTDGVLDAVDKHGELFGKDRLFDLLANAGELESGGIIETVRKELECFTWAAEPFDDITLLGIQYKLR